MKTVVVGTAGHIDHGKSALIRALTGIDPDRLKEEQARGITIDLGFAHLMIGDVQVAFVDVPGHERFVRNMLAGAGGIDAVMLVVAANESVKPQTREHFDICRLLGLEHGLVALTKTDIADADTAARATADVRELVKRSFLDSAPIIPVSAHTGNGLEALRSAIAALAGHAPRQHRSGVVRLAVDRAFSIKGFGAVVTGTLVSGTLAVGETIAVLPSGDAVRVRGLHVHGQAVTEVSAPQRVALNLAGVDAARLYRGVTMATPGALVATTRADVRVQLLRGARPLPHGTRVRVHHGTTEIFARVLIAATHASSGGTWAAAHPGDAGVEIAPGGDAYARLRFEEPAVLTRDDRLIVRAASPVATIGGARVLDPDPATGGVRRTAALARFLTIDGDTRRFVDLLLAESGTRGLDAAALVRRAGLDPHQAGAELDHRAAGGKVITCGTLAFATAAVESLRDRILAELTQFHQAHPAEPGVPRETLRSRIGSRAAPELFDAVLGGLVVAGTARAGERIGLASHQAPKSAFEDRARESVEARFRSAALTPPDPGAVAGELGLPEAEVQRLLRALVQAGPIVRVGDLFFHRDPLGTLRAHVAGLRAGQPADARVTLDVSAFKAQHGLSRKYAIPLLEWLDRERVTRRVGDARIVL